MEVPRRLYGKAQMTIFDDWTKADIISAFALLVGILAAILTGLTLKNSILRFISVSVVTLTAAFAIYTIATEAIQTRERTAAVEKARHNEIIREAKRIAEQTVRDRELAASAAHNQLDLLAVEQRVRAEVAKEMAVADARARVLKEQEERDKLEPIAREAKLLKERRALFPGSWVNEATGGVVEYIADGTIKDHSKVWAFLNSTTIVETHTFWGSKALMEIDHLTEHHMVVTTGGLKYYFKRAK